MTKWQLYKKQNPPGTVVTGTISRTEPFGVFVNLGVPYEALLLVPYISPIGKEKEYPNDYPKTGDKIECLIRFLGDSIAPHGKEKIALTQDLSTVIKADQIDPEIPSEPTQ